MKLQKGVYFLINLSLQEVTEEEVMPRLTYVFFTKLGNDFTGWFACQYWITLYAASCTVE